MDSSVEGGRAEVGVGAEGGWAELRCLTIDSSVGREVSSVGESGIRGSSTKKGSALGESVGDRKAYVLDHRRKEGWCCKSRGRLQPDSIEPRCSSMIVIFELVAR